MSKILIRFVSVVLIFALCFSFGCSKDKPKEETENQDPQYNEKKYSDTEIDFISDGKTDYKIVYPEEGYIGTRVQKAVTAIRNLMFEATGISIVADSDVNITSSSKIISVGNTRQVRSNNTIITKAVDANLGHDGYLIETIDDSIYLYSNSDYGVLYAAYELMRIYFNYEYYATDCYSLSREVVSCKLKAVNLVDIPDFEARTPSGSNFSDQMRAIPYTEHWNNADNNFFVHNVFQLVPPSTYMSAHPKWYTGSSVTDQLCLEAKGDNNERDALIDTVFYELKKRLEMQPEIDWISFSQNDSGSWCTCETCKHINEQYGALTAGYVSTVRFINEVAKKIKAWNKAECPERDIVIFIYSYGAVGKPPVQTDVNGKPKTDQNGNYMPISEDFILEDNVAVYFCYRFSANGEVSGENDTIPVGSDETFFDNIKRFKANMKNPRFYFWIYNAFFQDYLAPYEAVSQYKRQYKILKEVGTIGVFDQGVFNVRNNTDWYNLKNYVSSKLLWDIDLDVSTLEKSFMKEYFGEASEIMYKLYRETQQHTLYLITKGMIGAQSLKTQYWPYKTLTYYLDLINKAYEAIKPIQFTDVERYNAIYNRILCESISYRYVILQLYPSYYSVPELEEMQHQFMADCARVSITHFAENSSIDSLFTI